MPTSSRLSMRLLCTVSPILLAAAAFATTPDAPGDRDGVRQATGTQWTIVATYPVPEGASGLAYDGTFLYCGIYGSNGSEIHRIDPDTGETVLLFNGPQADAFGLTFDGQYLWTTDHPGSSSTPAVAMQLDWNGNLLSQFELPAHYLSGIAYDNGDFWVSRYYPDPGHIYKLDGTGALLDEFDAPDNQPWDLCLENNNLWMADYWGDALYKIDPQTGAVLESHPSEGVDPAGIVWDGQHLWYCDNGEGFDQDFLYKVDLQGGGTPAVAIPVSSHDFGTVAIGQSVTWPMTVQNLGTADLNISDVTFDPPDGLSCPTEFPLIIPAGGSADLDVIYAPQVFAPLQATGTVLSNDPIHPAEPVALSGHGVYPDPTLTVPEAAHNFGPVRINAHTRWFMEIRNDGLQTLTINDITIDDPHYYLDDSVTLPIALDTLEAIDVGVWFNPDAVAVFGAAVTLSSNDPLQDPVVVPLNGSGLQAEYPIGSALWSYLIDIDFDNSPKAMAAIPDISGDGVADVIVCSEDDFVRCFNGNSDGTADILWEHEIPSGAVYSQNGLQITDDIDGDGHSDVVVGSVWGARLIRTLSGATGLPIWTHDTHEYGNGGWVYQVDCSYDYNGDGIRDVLACTGDDSSDTGPKRVYCLDGITGLSIWERFLGGPGFGVVGVQDFTGDGQPDVVAGASDEGETEGRVFGLDGVDGGIVWTFLADGSSVWAIAQVGDITADGVPDVMVGDFSFGSGRIYGLDASNGDEIYFGAGYGGITRLVAVDDVTGDGEPDVVPAHFGTSAVMINGQTGTAAWSTPLADKSAVAARSADVSGDGVNDVVIGTLFSSNFAYFLDGVDGTILHATNYGTPVDAIAAVPDIVGDGSWEMVIGGRDGLVTCLSGGLNAAALPADLNMDGAVNSADLALLLGAWGPNPGHPADLNGDGIVNSADLALLLGSWSGT